MRVVVGTFDHDRFYALAEKDPATLVFTTRWRLAARRGKVAAFAPEYGKFFSVLLAGAVRMVERHELIEAMWGDRDDGGPADMKCIDVRLCNLRKEIAPLGVFIETEWGRGWRIWGDTAPGDKVYVKAEEVAAARPRKRYVEPAFMVGVR